MDMSLALAGLGLFGGIVIWAIRQEGRLNTHDQQHAEHKTQIEKVAAEALRRHDEVREDLLYIRQRIDAALNGKH